MNERKFVVTIQINTQGDTKDFVVYVSKGLAEKTAFSDAIKLAQQKATSEGFGTVVKAVREALK